MESNSSIKSRNRGIAANGTSRGATPLIPPTDSELLMRFVRYRDETAFTELVEKHAPLVWSVCWHVLNRHHDIEDAFQATFLILAKRAGTIRSCDSLASWLYRVAYRTALRARFTLRKNATAELGEEVAADPEDRLAMLHAQEQKVALLEELHILPEKYQTPVVLCYLDGKSRRAAADELGCTLETVKGRLARGKQLLRQRLIRRGVSLSLAMSALSVSMKSAQAALTTPLIVSTAGGGGGIGISGQGPSFSPYTLQLTREGIIAMKTASLTKSIFVGLALISFATASWAVASAEGNADSDNTSSTTVDLQQKAEAEFAQPMTPAEASVDVVTNVTAPVTSPDLDLTVAPPTPPVVAMTPPQPTPPAVSIAAPRIQLDLNHDLDVQQELQSAEHQMNILELQLQAKELEIQALAHEGRQREELMMQSRRVLAQAEAEHIRAQLEQQKALLEKLAHRTKDMTSTLPPHNENGEKVSRLEALLAQARESMAAAGSDRNEIRQEIEKSMERDAARAVAEQLKAQLDQQRALLENQVREKDEKFAQLREALSHAEANLAATRESEAKLKRELQELRKLKEWAEQQADEARKQAQDAAEQAARAEANSQRYSQRAQNYAPPKLMPPEPTEVKLQSGDELQIEVLGTPPDSPISNDYTVEPMGTVALGAAYGRVKVAGLTVLEAEEAILKHLSKELSDPKVQVVLVNHSRTTWQTSPGPAVIQPTKPIRPLQSDPPALQSYPPEPGPSN